MPLGSWSFAPGAGHNVTLTAAAVGTTIADAMLFVGPGGQPANLLYVHADHLGSPQKLSDAGQATVWDGVFDPFGEEFAVTGLAAMQMRFPGQYADEETGYRYNYFRDYEPRLGRYLQSDPIGLRGGLSTYVYTLNHPVGFADRRGLVIDTAADIGFVCGDLLKILIDNVIMERGNLNENLGALAADATGLVTPFATGAGQAYRAANKVAKNVPDRLPDDAIVCRGGQCTAEVDPEFGTG
jgi:RHS repeat-associated protein